MLQSSLDFECELLRRFDFVCGVDEVGRGALAGPVYVGAAVVDASTGPVPPGLTDSKKLVAKRREVMASAVRGWARAVSVGSASPAEVDAFGVNVALRRAAMRALAVAVGSRTGSGVILLDGSFDWISGSGDLFECSVSMPVVTRVKADLHCASVSAASIVAKVARDDFMRGIDDPGYDWASNKGYASARHRAALVRLGASRWHRVTWRLPQMEVS